MSLSRAELAARLWSMLQRQFLEVGIENEDSPGNLGDPVDSTLLALGVSYGDLTTGAVDDGDEHKALVIARYQGLRAVYDAALAKVDVTIDAPNTSVRWSQYAANIRAALTEAKADAEPFMVTVASSFAFGALSLDFIEPCTLEG